MNLPLTPPALTRQDVWSWFRLCMLMLGVAGAMEFSASAQSSPGTFSGKNIIGGVKRQILNRDGAALKASVGRVELLRNGVLLAAGAPAVDGTFVLGVIDVEGTSLGDTITITVRAWDSTTGNTYSTASVRGSEEVQVGPLGGGTVPPAEMSNFTGFQLARVTGGTPGDFSARNLIGTEKRYILDPAGNPLAAAAGAVEFLANGSVFLTGGLVEDGVFALGVAAIPGSSIGGVATITVRAWDKTTGATFDAATIRGSEAFMVGPLGGDLNPPAVLANFQSLQLTVSSSIVPGTFSAKNLIGAEKRYILDPSGKPLATAFGAVDLLVNNSVVASGNLVEDGIFVLGSVTVPGAAEGSSVSVTIRAWDKSTGSTYDLATTRGSSTISVGPLGGSITPPVGMSEFTSFQLVATPVAVGGTFSAKNLIGTERRYILNLAGAPLPVAVGAVDIVYQGTVIKSGALALDGVFAFGTVAVPGTSLGDTVTLTVRAWDTSSGATFDAATKKGTEDVLVGPLGGDITPPVGMANFKSFSISDGLLPPKISVQPAASVVKNQNDSVTLTVTATGSGLSYQWQKEGVNLKDSAGISGSSTAALRLTALSPANRGNYRVVVSNSGGAATSRNCIVGVLVPQSINFGTLPDLKYGDSGGLNVTASSGLKVVVKVVSGPATLIGTNLTATWVGSVVLSATQAGSSEFQPADAITTLTIKKASQKLTWATLPTLTYGAAPFQLKVTASSGLGVTLSAPANSALSVTGSTITVVSAGTGTLTATQGGTLLFEPVTETRDSIAVAKATQTLSFAAIADTAWKTSGIALNATASSKLPVSFSVASGPAQVAGSTLSLQNTGVGVVTVNATQAGDSNFLPATTVSRSFTVSKATQTVTFGALPSVTEGDPAIKLAATASSGLPIIYTSSGPAATIAGDQLTPAAAGSAVITAKQAGNVIFLAAQATQTITVRAKLSVPPTAVLQLTGTDFKILFRGEKGRAHAIEAVSTLGATWQEISTANGAGLDTDVTILLPSSSERMRFFRVRAK